MSPRPPAKHERRDEYAASLIIERNIDCLARHIDDGKTQSSVDYLIENRAGTVLGAVEVGRNTNAGRQRISKAFNKYASEPLAASELKESWNLTCWRENAPIFKGLQERALPILLDLEASGRRTCDAWSSNRYIGGTPEYLLGEMRVRSAHALAPFGDTAKIWVSIASGGTSATSPEAPLHELELWLHSSESDPCGHRAKLQATRLPQRHSFVWVDFHSEFAAHHQLDADELPNRPPRLPAEITAVWLTSERNGWFWLPGKGWKRLEGVAAAVAATRDAYFSLDEGN